MKLISIGFGNTVNADRIVAVVSPEAAPVKRIVQLAKDNGTAIDATCGRRTKSFTPLTPMRPGACTCATAISQTRARIACAI